MSSRATLRLICGRLSCWFKAPLDFVKHPCYYKPAVLNWFHFWTLMFIMQCQQKFPEIDLIHILHAIPKDKYLYGYFTSISYFTCSTHMKSKIYYIANLSCVIVYIITKCNSILSLWKPVSTKVIKVFFLAILRKTYNLGIKV